MDWSRTKTILIIALVFTNAILGWMVYGGAVTNFLAEASSQEAIDEVITLLASRDIDVRADMLVFPPTLQGLKMTYTTFDEEILANKLLEKPITYVNGYYTDGMYKLDVKETQELVYENLAPLAPAEPMSEERAIEVSILFLLDSGLYDNDSVIQSTETLSNGDIRVVFTQTIDDYFAEDSYIIAKVRGEQLISLRMKWFKEFTKLEQAHDIVPLEHALFQIAPDIDADTPEGETSVVTSVDLGYTMVNSPLFNPLSGEAAPYWRITVNEEQFYYVPAEKK